MQQSWPESGRHDDDSRRGSGSGSSSRPSLSSGTTPRIGRNRPPSHSQQRDSHRLPSSELKLERNRVGDTNEAHYNRFSNEAQSHSLRKDMQRKKSKGHASTDEEDAFERFQKRKEQISASKNGSHLEEKESKMQEKPRFLSDESEDDRHHTSNGRVNGHHDSGSSRGESRRDSRRDDSRGHDSSRHESRGYDSRGHNSSRHESRGYDSRGHDSSRHESRGYDSRVYESRRHDRRDDNRESNGRRRDYDDRGEDRRRRDDESRDNTKRYDGSWRDSGTKVEDNWRKDKGDRRVSHSVYSRSYESNRAYRPKYDDDREEVSRSRRDDNMDHRDEERRHHRSHHSHSSSHDRTSRHEVNGDRHVSETRSRESNHPREEPAKKLMRKVAPLVETASPSLPVPVPVPIPIPITPSPPLPPSVELSFKPVKMPHELLKPANADLIPTRSDGKRLMPYLVMYDPELQQSREANPAAKKVKEEEPAAKKDKDDASNVRKGIVKKTAFDGERVDPRRKDKQPVVRSQFRIPVYKWDRHSTKAKPPGPPCAVLVTGASPVMISSKIRFHFQSFGKVADVESRIDQLGQSLGIFYVRFRQDYDDNLKLKADAREESAQRGDMVALEAVKNCFISGESVKVSLDDEAKTQFNKVCNEEMAKRTAPRPKPIQAPPVNLPASLSGSPMPPPEAPTSSSTPNSALASTVATSVIPTPATAVPSNASALAVAPRFLIRNRVGHHAVVQSNNRVAGTKHSEHWSNSAPPAHWQAAARRPVKASWSDQELLTDAKLLILRELGETFMRDIKTRTITPFLKEFLKSDKAGGQALRPPPPEVIEEQQSSESEIETKSIKGRRRRLVEEERQRVGITPESTEMSEISRSDEEGDVIVAESVVGEEVDKGENRKKKGGARKKKSLIASDAEELATEEETAVAVPTIRAKAKKAAVKKAKEKVPALDPISLGLAEDEEDLYYLKVALEKIKSGKSLAEVQAEEWEAIEVAEQLESGQGVNGLPRHASGSARTEGVYRIPPAEKAVHMPDRNRAVVDPSSVVGFASARGNRADSRRFVQGIEQHKKETATDTDILKFNQLRSRKKQLKFSKSPIHDWGLYAVELIPAGDMVIEYVGEIVRQQVADQREKMYERQGNFSTYLFRVDDDVVVDATKKGNIARLMNHCCTPNCNAKILTLNGEKRIVLFAQKPILPGQELTYDYKFQATGDEEDAIACLCGSPGCRRFL